MVEEILYLNLNFTGARIVVVSIGIVMRAIIWKLNPEGHMNNVNNLKGTL